MQLNPGDTFKTKQGELVRFIKNIEGLNLIVGAYGQDFKLAGLFFKHEVLGA